MLTQKQLQAILSDLESDRIERTASTSNTDKFAQAVCAFANDYPNHRQPGYLIVGVNDNGAPSGLTVTDQLLQNLGALRSDGNILPIPALSVNRFQLEGGQVAVVEVQPSDLPPVRYKGQIWLRVGPRKAIASEQEERILMERRVANASSFDATPVFDASINDLSLPLFEHYRQQVIDPEIIEANHRPVQEQLASLRFFSSVHQVPTVAGILMFGKHPRYFFPGAYVQFLRLPGTTLTELPDDQAEISGDLPSILRELDIRLKANIRTKMEPASALRERLVPDYPQIAVRELLINAILHRNYQSNTPVRFYWFQGRIEIQSPGGLYGETTLQTLTSANSYRNPILAECMKSLGYVNRFGYGIQRATALLQQNGNPPPEFMADDRVFLNIIRHRPT